MPYALLILLVEFTIGGLWVLYFSQARGQSAASFVKFGAVMTTVMAIITLLVAADVDVGDQVDGYPLNDSWMDEVRWGMVAFLAFSGLHSVATVLSHRVPQLVLGAGACVAGLTAIAGLAAVIAEPTWGFGLVLASLAVAALVVGAVTQGMILGHWYLVTPRLPEQPFREMTGLLVVVFAVQLVLLIPALALPHDEVNTSVDTDILSNPFFYLRVGMGIAFPGMLAWMAWDSSGARAMMSATGLLYIAMALVLAGEVVGRGLMFASGVPN
ncbi:MAG TPA: hypothetical protein VMR52_01965 [Dehalococcoidia bacterium]|nr:hypothetical protein [Dehalococcoidia bacterium]